MKEYIVQAIAQETIDSFDAHNAPELIRCKNCKYWHETIYDTPKWLPCMSAQTSGNWFCADGERKN